MNKYCIWEITVRSRFNLVFFCSCRICRTRLKALEKFINIVVMYELNACNCVDELAVKAVGFHGDVPFENRAH